MSDDGLPSEDVREADPHFDRVDKRMRVNLDRLVEFLFPKNCQHPLVAGRLIAFGLYGPLDEQLNLRSGFRGSRVLLDYELEQCCLQLEREDIVSIYLHRKRDLGLLTSEEQEAIIAQADARLKMGKGKASLPRLTNSDIFNMFRHLRRSREGLLSFHDMQCVIENWRTERINAFKLVFPEMSSGNNSKSGSVRKEAGGQGTWRPKRGVSSAIAPKTLFQKKKGLTNADVVEAQVRLLGKYAFQVLDIDNKNGQEGMTSNVRLLRDVEPTVQGVYDPHFDKATGKSSAPKWSKSTAFKLGTH